MSIGLFWVIVILINMELLNQLLILDGTLLSKSISLFSKGEVKV
jgi:hypothetical protein